VLTGNVIRPTCFGRGKLLAAEDLAERCDLDLDGSYFYTDSIDDLPLLENVGHPRPTNPDRRLAQIAKERRWPVQRFSSRGRPDLEQIARTAGDSDVVVSATVRRPREVIAEHSVSSVLPC